jgi:hypothetical protein
MDNISERLRFLIDTQAPQAEGDEKKRQGLSKTLATLERRTGIAESKWRNLMRGQTKAGEETIEAAIKLWPWYAEWLTTGGLLGVEQKDPLRSAEAPGHKGMDEDIHLRRGKTPDSPNEVSIEHTLKLRQRPQGPEPLTSDTLEWGYFGAGPCELAANILYKFGVPEERAIDLRIKFARDVVANLNRNDARIPAETVHDWIRKNT